MKMLNPLEILYKRANMSNADYCLFSLEEALDSDELWEKSCSFATKLVERGVSPGCRVVISGNNSRNTIIMLYACWLAQAIVLPLDASIKNPKENLIAKQFKADFFIISDQELLVCLKSGRKYIIDIYGIDYDSAHAGMLLKGVRASKGALCLFTSGSTGEPKGVLLSLEALTYGAKNVIDAFQLKSDDIAFCVLPLTHINGLVTTLLAPLYSNSKVLFYQSNFYEDVENALSVMSEYNCSWMSAIPMHYNAMISCNDVQKYGLKLRFCRSAASPLSPQILERFEQKYSVPLIETLGMTETAGQIFANPLPPAKRIAGSVGKPVNFEVSLFAEHIQDGINSEVGEVIVRGNAMMLGYLDDAKYTKDIFADNWLKTGDLAKKDSEGYYYIVGRKKHMVIFAGINIPLGQIERAIADEREEVYAAVCLKRADRIFGEVFDIFIELAHGYENYIDNEHDYYKVIKRIVNAYIPVKQALKKILIVDSIPKTSVGKIDRTKLSKIYDQ